MTEEEYTEEEIATTVQLLKEKKSDTEIAAQLQLKEDLKLLDEPETELQYLDLGITKDQKKFYFGIKIANKDAIITSDKQLLRNTTEQFKGKIIGEDSISQELDYLGRLGEIAPFWRKSSVKQFLTETKNLDKKSTFKKIREKILYYMDFGDLDNIADVQTCFIIATYGYPLFYWFPHILFNAPAGSGKSKNAFTMMQLAFRGFDLGASAGVTGAQLYRTLEGNRGTILIDEYEQSDSETQKIVNQILNASCTRDSYIIRNEQVDRKWVATKFPIFCPKIVCNISGINPTSLTRFIPFTLLKTLDEKGKRKPYAQKDIESFKPLRDELHVLMLENWKEIKNVYETLEVNLNNRDEDNWRPLLAVAKWLGEDVYNSVLDYANSCRELSIETNDLKADFFSILFERVQEEKFYTPKELSEFPEVQDLLSAYKSPPHWIGKQLKSYKFATSRGGGVRKYVLSPHSIRNIIERYFTNIIAHNNTNTTNNTNDTNNTNNTENPKNPQNSGKIPEKGVICGVSVITQKPKGVIESALDFVSSKGNGGCDVDEFCQKFSDEVMIKLIERGDIFAAKNRLRLAK